MNLFEENEAHEVGFQPDGGLQHDSGFHLDGCFQPDSGLHLHSGFHPDGDLLVDIPNHEQAAFPPNSMSSHNLKNQRQLNDSDLFLTLNNNFAPSNNCISQEPILKEGEESAHPWKKYPGPTSQDLVLCYKAKDHQGEKNYFYPLHSENEATSIEMTYDGFLNDNNYSKSRSMSLNFTDHSDDGGGSSAPPGGKANDDAGGHVNGEVSMDSGKGKSTDEQEGDAKVNIADEASKNGEASEHVEVSKNGKAPRDGDGDSEGGNGGGSDSGEAKEGNAGEGEKVDEHKGATNDGGEVDGRGDNPQANEEGEKNGDEEEVPPVEEVTPMEEVPPVEEVTPMEEVIPVEESTPMEEAPPVEAPPAADLQSEIAKLKEDIKNMKKEKIHLLAKFKAYTLNNKREIERLEGECKGRADEVRALEGECRGKERQIEQISGEVAQLKDELAQISGELALLKDEREGHQGEIKQKEEELEELRSRCSASAAQLQEANMLRRQNDSLKAQLEEEHSKMEKLQSSVGQQGAEGNKLKLHLRDEDVLFLFSTESSRLVCFAKNGEHHIVEEESFRQSYPSVKVPPSVQEEHLSELRAHEREEALRVEKIAEGGKLMEAEKKLLEEEKSRVDAEKKLMQEEMTRIEGEKKLLEGEMTRIEAEKKLLEEEFLAYKQKVSALISETNENWKNVEEKNETIQRMSNSLLKYEQDIETYQNEVSTLTGKCKALEGQICREKNLREQQNGVVAELKKQMQKEKAEIKRRCREQFDEECQQKVNEVKAVFSEKEALLQSKIQLLLRQVDRMAFSSEGKSQAKQAEGEGWSERSEQWMSAEQTSPPAEQLTPPEKWTPPGQPLPPLGHAAGDPSPPATGEKGRSGGSQEKRDSQKPPRSEVGSEGNVDCVLPKSNKTEGFFPHLNLANHCEKDKYDDGTKIPIYPNEYKKIRKKLDTYELVISEEKKEKKNLLEHINVLTSQIKVYESISGNHEQVLYQKNILQNFIAQIPANTKIDDYVSVIYNTFNFSPQEIEQINAKRAKR
ncbi:conserved Plasmodium protein, unknown function [Plasmodium vivax]|uniref:GRIP domain-containing protein n=1 Tax=Plasmodium vivax TaxID=5855 RepID=A0A1G4GX13_PLAVI|nr:conserved Plasmodium protein, unknown function [Plasmodium vivax]